MHLQMLHATEFGIESLGKSNRPKSVCSFRSSKSKSVYRNCLAVFASVEKGDDENSIFRAVTETEKVYRQLRGKRDNASACRELVVIPYSHQRNVETRGQIAYQILEQVYLQLRERIGDSVVFLGDFGFSNKWSVEVKSHKLSCVYREA